MVQKYLMELVYFVMTKMKTISMKEKMESNIVYINLIIGK